MAGGLIIQRNAGVTVPESYLERVLKATTPRCMGVAFADKGQLQINHVLEPPNMDVLKAALAVNPEGQVFVHLGLYPSTFDQADVQPFILACENDELDHPLLCVLMEGDFVANTQNSSHLDAYHLSDYLIDKANELLKEFDGDFDKVLRLFRGKSSTAEIEGRMKQGSMVFLPADGQAWAITKDIKYAREFPEFGWVSNTHGWNPTKEVAKDNSSERLPEKKSFSAMRGKAPIIAETKTDTAIPAGTEQPTIVDQKPKDFPDAYVTGDPEPPTSALKLFTDQVWDNLKLKYLKSAITRLTHDGKLPPECEIVQDGPNKGKPVTDKAQIDRSKLVILTKDWMEWDKRRKNKELASAKPAEPEKKKLTPEEKLALQKAKKSGTQPPPPAAPKPPEPVEASTGNEFVPIPSQDSHDEVDTIIIDEITERKIPHPTLAKEMDKLSFTARFGLGSVRDLKLRPGAIWTLTQKHQVECYLLIQELFAELEKLAPSTAAKQGKAA